MSLADRKNLADEIKQKVKAIECHTQKIAFNRQTAES